MDFGFSYIGLIFLVMLFVPNIVWSKNMPKDYDRYAGDENRVLSLFERLGQVLGVVFSLFINLNVNPSPWLVVLIIAFLFMILYELYWIRYFKSPRRMEDMYSNFLGIPVAGATLPVLAFLFLGIYGNNPFLIISTLILAIGHIGIHLNHKNKISGLVE